MENGGRELLLDGALTIQQLTYCIPHPIYPTNAPKLFPITYPNVLKRTLINFLLYVSAYSPTCLFLQSHHFHRHPPHFLVAISFLFNLVLYQDKIVLRLPELFNIDTYVSCMSKMSSLTKK